MAKKTLAPKPKTIGYLRVSTGLQDLDKNKADILRLANQEDLGRGDLSMDWIFSQSRESP